jgi:hypothetical protein
MLTLSPELLYECVLEDGKTIMTTLTNSGYLLYTLNMLKSLVPYGLDKKVLLVCVDSKAADTLIRLGYSTVVSIEENTLGGFCAWNTKGYDQVCYWKLELIYRVLSVGMNILLVDGDIVFRSDPREDLRVWWEDRLYDVWCQNDSSENRNTRNMCTGYMFIKSSARLIELYDCVSSAGQAKYKSCAFDNNDQTFFNRYVKPAIMMCAIPLEKYPNGQYFYDVRPVKPVLVHFNWVQGHLKMAKMKEHRMWLLTEEEEDAI